MNTLIPLTTEKPKGRHNPFEWSRLVGVAIIWGTAFILLKTAVTEIPPTTVVMARLWIGTITLFIWMRIRGHTLPRLIGPMDERWKWFMVLGLTGAVAPFALISWGQQSLDSALVGILMAFMPLATAALAHVFVPGESMTARKFGGFILGFAGVALLMGPDVLTNLGGAHSLAQIAVVSAAVFYAIQSIIARNLPATSPSVSAAGMILCASIIITPLGIYEAWNMPIPSATALLSVLTLGIGATGLAGIVMMAIIRDNGPSFFSMSNYIMPPVAVIVGLLFGEQLGITVWIGFAVILAGLALAQSKGKAR